jgi:Zn-dependent M16 (insulinase) family peptidase
MIPESNYNLFLKYLEEYSPKGFKLLSSNLKMRNTEGKYTNLLMQMYLFFSLHTVNTHRRNILKKTGKETISELIYDLMERGLL